MDASGLTEQLKKLRAKFYGKSNWEWLAGLVGALLIAWAGTELVHWIGVADKTNEERPGYVIGLTLLATGVFSSSCSSTAW